MNVTSQCHARALDTARVLYRVIICPSLPSPRRPDSKAHHVFSQRLAKVAPFRSFSATSLRQLKPGAIPPRRPEKWDEEIEGPTVLVIDDKSSTVSQPLDLRHALTLIDRKIERLVQVGAPDPSDPNGYARCKVVNKLQAYEREKRKREEKYAQRKLGGGSLAPKQLELNWAIGAGDLSHRMGKMKEFLEQGRKVEIILAAKKRGRRATEEECRNVLACIRQTADSVPGSTTIKELEGPLGQFASMMLRGKVAAGATQ